MGDITLTKAEYVVADQTIDVLSVLTEIQTKNYGAIDLPIATLDSRLRKDNRIVAKADADALKLTPPKLSVDYLDETGAYHHAETALTETLKLGERSSFGQLVQKPGELLWNLALVAAKGQFLFVFAFAWAIVVLWSYKQFQFLETAFDPNSSPPGIVSRLPADGYPAETYGLIGRWVLVGLWYLFYAMQIPSKPLGIMFGAVEPPYGWLTKVVMSLASALAPVAGFFFQFMIWFTAVQSIPSV
jgi:hypothetical protein